MTELEKKAEEYTEKNTRGISLSIYAIESIYKAYKDGYEQGMKSLWCCEHSEEICCVLTDSRLVKQENETLKWEQKQILEDNEYWQTQFEKADKERAELEKAVTEFSSVIEKMKCCENCKHNQNKLEDNEVCWNCERQCSKLGEEVIKDEWELAE